MGGGGTVYSIDFTIPPALDGVYGRVYITVNGITTQYVSPFTHNYLSGTHTYNEGDTVSVYVEAHTGYLNYSSGDEFSRAGVITYNGMSVGKSGGSGDVRYKSYSFTPNGNTKIIFSVKWSETATYQIGTCTATITDGL